MIIILKMDLIWISYEHNIQAWHDTICNINWTYMQHKHNGMLHLTISDLDLKNPQDMSNYQVSKHGNTTKKESPRDGQTLRRLRCRRWPFENWPIFIYRWFSYWKGWLFIIVYPWLCQIARGSPPHQSLVEKKTSTGWWLNPTSLKKMSSSIGIMTFPM